MANQVNGYSVEENAKVWLIDGQIENDVLIWLSGYQLVWGWREKDTWVWQNKSNGCSVGQDIRVWLNDCEAEKDTSA